ncbi:MAG: response regulator [Sphingobacteriaceae bacterium]|nr:response regulator [Sphingobacteriaceae bacterium]
MKIKQANFIIVDDSELDCFIAEKLVKHSGMSNKVISFLRAEDALDFVKGNPFPTDQMLTVILLDILMPIMSGIDFVEEFEKLPADVQKKYIIVAFTSSMNKKDMATMQSFKSVKCLYDKPLSPEVLSTLLDDTVLFPE